MQSYRDLIGWQIARGSKHEVEAQLLICTRLNFMKDSEIRGTIRHVMKSEECWTHSSKN